MYSLQDHIQASEINKTPWELEKIDFRLDVFIIVKCSNYLFRDPRYNNSFTAWEINYLLESWYYEINSIAKSFEFYYQK